MPSPAIEVKGLHKSYGEFEAVRGVDLTVQAGEVFALLGPNGAGKTTTVEIMEGHRKRSSGEVRILGFDPGKRERALKERIGIVLQETGVNRFLTVAEVIDQFRGYYPHPRPTGEIIELVGLTEKRDELVRKLSGGQQRRLDVAVGLAGDPDLLFLDEPTTGFDPSARRNAWSMIKSLNQLGKTVFLTTHYMDEAQFLADRVAIIVGGKIAADGTPDGLAQSLSVDPRATYSVANDQAPQLLELAQEHGIELREVGSSKPSLEDVYLELTKDAERQVNE
jgi:ABC-2 type transport system ATP-binding protein